MAMGAPDDFAAFWRVEWPRVVGALTLYTGSPELAEELAQDAAARAARDWKKVRALESPGGWLYRVALNLARSRFRRDRVARNAQHLLARRAEQHDPDAVDAIAVRAAVGALPERERAVILLRYWLDLSEADIAHAVRAPVGTVKTLARRALKRLREQGLLDDNDAGTEARVGHTSSHT
jgi:RNA polymerase sigma-70 factor (ECF subfamily)